VIHRITYNQSRRDVRDFPYFLGKGCDEHYNDSDDELKKEIEKEFEYIDRERFKKLVEDGLKKYPINANNNQKYNQCYIITKRVLIILDSI
jgi:hypothetical protein